AQGGPGQVCHSARILASSGTAPAFMHTIDFSDPAIIADPYPALHALQDDEPAHWNPGLRSWCLTRYDDVTTALRDPRYSSDRIRPFLHGQHRVTADSIAQM